MIKNEYLRRLLKLIWIGAFIVTVFVPIDVFCYHIIIEKVDITQNLLPVIYFTLIDKEGSLLKNSRLRIYIDGRELCEAKHTPGENEFFIDSCSNVSGQRGHSSIILAFDVSLSVDKDLWNQGRDAILECLKGVTPNCKIMLLSFGSSIKQLAGFSQNMEMIKKEIMKIEPRESKTLLCNAVYKALEILEQIDSKKKKLVLLTDGIDDGSYLTKQDCIDALRRCDISVDVFDVGKQIGSSSNFLRRMAKISGGKYIHIKKGLKPEYKFEELAKPSKVSYAVSFNHSALNKPGFHQLRIEFWDRKNQVAVIETKKTFYVPFRKPVAKPRHSILVSFKDYIRHFWILRYLLPLLLLALLVTHIIMKLHEKGQKEVFSVELGELRKSIKRLQQDAQRLEQQIWEYGSPREEKINRWKLVSHEIARKAVSVLKSCWLDRDNPSVRVIYEELVSNLKTIGVEEINPQIGEKIDENDTRYWIREKRGLPPYKVSRVIYPGYYFRPRLGRLQEKEDEILLEPAQIEVQGR